MQLHRPATAHEKILRRTNRQDMTVGAMNSQIAALKARNTVLEDENRALREENAECRAWIDRFDELVGKVYDLKTHE